MATKISNDNFYTAVKAPAISDGFIGNNSINIYENSGNLSAKFRNNSGTLYNKVLSNEIDILLPAQSFGGNAAAITVATFYSGRSFVATGTTSGYIQYKLPKNCPNIPLTLSFSYAPTGTDTGTIIWEVSIRYSIPNTGLNPTSSILLAASQITVNGPGADNRALSSSIAVPAFNVISNPGAEFILTIRRLGDLDTFTGNAIFYFASIYS